MADIPWARNGLVAALEVLARDPAGQVAWLKEIFDWVDEIGPSFNVDELALEHHEFVQLLPQVLAAGMVSTAAASAVEAVDAQLDRMSGQEHAELWTVSALSTSAEWATVRRLARIALRLVQPTLLSRPEIRAERPATRGWGLRGLKDKRGDHLWLRSPKRSSRASPISVWPGRGMLSISMVRREHL